MALINLPFPEFGKGNKVNIQNLYDMIVKFRKELEFALYHIEDENISSLSADKITFGTLDASKVNIINL